MKNWFQIDINFQIGTFMLKTFFQPAELPPVEPVRPNARSADSSVGMCICLKRNKGVQKPTLLSDVL
jgi:hypothetical protein